MLDKLRKSIDLSLIFRFSVHTRRSDGTDDPDDSDRYDIPLKFKLDFF